MVARFRLTWFLLVLLSTGALAQDEFADRLKAIPSVKEVVASTRGENTTYDVTFEQPVDHQNPGGARFGQHIFIRHRGYDQPVLLGTEGYSARGAGGGELATMLGTPNLVTVEHRYFGRSMPEPVVWKHLTVKNAADDMHAIVTALKSLYRGRWVATGASKGGQTALYYKCYYPDDVDAVVAYVAPINLAQEDPRINQFMATVGDAATRERIEAFQIALLKREDEVLPLLQAKESDYSMGLAKAYEYGVLEFPYAFWQYGSNVRPDSIPGPDATAQQLADAYKRVNAIYYYSDAGIRQFQAFQYQAFTEVGYYNYDITRFKPYLKANPDPTNLDLCPPGTKDTIAFNPQAMAFVFHTLQYRAQNIVFIYGETDAWSSTQMTLLGRTNALKIVVKGAWHNANVRLMSPEQKESFYTTLESWLGFPIVRLHP